MNQPENIHSSKQRREFIGGALAGMAGGLVLSTAAHPAIADHDKQAKPKREAFRPPGAPSADVGDSPAILGSGEKYLFISGQGPEDVKADMETQVRQTFDRIGLLLEAAGAGFENVVIIRSFWVHLLRDLPIYRKVRLDYLKEPFPASTAVGTPELAIPGLELEIEAVAVL